MDIKNTVERLYQDNLLWLILGALISADTLIDKESCEKSLNKLSEYEQQTTIAHINQEEKMQILEFIRNGKKIVENDLKIFS